VSDAAGRRAIRIELPIVSEEELAALRGALLAARASELGEVQRRSARHTFGYGTDIARESMTHEVANRRRRLEMLDRLLAALDAAPHAAPQDG
jgi:hypothetical protein